MLENKAYACVFDKLARSFDALCFIFFGDMSVETDGKFHARPSDNFLLLFVFEKLRHVVVRFEGVQTVVIDVQLPKDTVFRHFPKITIGVFATGSDKLEKVGMRDADGTT